MSSAEDTRVALFESVHYVLAAERIFQRAGVWCDLIPTPRGLSSDCGMAIAFRETDAAKAEELLRDPRLRLRALYRLSEETWIPIDDPATDPGAQPEEGGR